MDAYAMTSPSVSFRISRHAEDLAETLHALSQRLVAMEQRLGAMELQLTRLREQPREDAAELAGLAEVDAHIERLLLDCRELLASGSERAQPDGALPLQQGGFSDWSVQPEAPEDAFHKAA
jgi:hypothetical protein